MAFLGESGLVGQCIVIRIRRITVQTSLCTWVGLGTQPFYDGLSDRWTKVDKKQWLTSG